MFASLLHLVGVAAVASLGAGLMLAFRREVVLQVRGRLMLSVAAAGVTLVLLWLVPASFAVNARGAVTFASPGVAAAAALAAFALPPWRRPFAHEVRIASLITREPYRMIPRPAAVRLGALTGLAVLLVLVGGLTASDDDLGYFSRVFTATHGPMASSAGPYPGWYYGLPTLGALTLLFATVLLAGRRLAYLPATAQDESRDHDWRAAAGSAVIGLAQTAVLLYITGLALGLQCAPSVMIDLGVAGPWEAVRIVLWIVCFAAAAGALLSGLGTVVRAARIGGSSREASPVSV